MLVDLPNEKSSERLAGKFVRSLTGANFVCGLSGPLGAGKSTLARAILRVMGVTGPIPSPTYTLIEPYFTEIGLVHHVDLYRIGSDAEIMELGLGELLEQSVLMLIEWPERDRDRQVPIDLELRLEHRAQGRRVRVSAASDAGKQVEDELLRQLNL